ncbi:MAG: epoxyqueuosine reductase QueH [bacterium]
MKKMKSQKNRLLLHTCCADCALKFIKSIGDEYNITLLFDNDNIHPRTEYLARLEVVKKISKDENVELVISDWSPKKWFKSVDKKEREQKRCCLCWKHRLTKAARYSKENGFPLFSTTLLSSHYQDSKEIERIGIELEEKKLKFFVPKNIKQVETFGFYKQNYCGCVYSLKDRYFEKYSQ